MFIYGNVFVIFETMKCLISNNSEWQHLMDLYVIIVDKNNLVVMELKWFENLYISLQGSWSTYQCE